MDLMRLHIVVDLVGMNVYLLAMIIVPWWRRSLLMVLLLLLIMLLLLLVVLLLLMLLLLLVVRDLVLRNSVRMHLIGSLKIIQKHKIT